VPDKRKQDRTLTDSPEYLAKKAVFAKLTTIYGRYAVEEALIKHPHPPVVRLLLATELSEAIAGRMQELADAGSIPVRRMPREKLSRITKNAHEDQGMAADLDVRLLNRLSDLIEDAPPRARLLALSGVTTPANIGIIIRSVAAAGIDGLVVTSAGCPAPTLPLVIKASAGNIFRTKIYTVTDADELIKLVQGADWAVYGLASTPAAVSIFDHVPPARAIYLLGNESIGLPKSVLSAMDGLLSIPLANGVESLNVAAAGSIVAYQVR